MTATPKPPPSNWRDREVLTATQVAAVLHLSMPTVYAAIRDGSIRSVRIGHKHLIPVSALIALIDGTTA